MSDKKIVPVILHCLKTNHKYWLVQLVGWSLFTLLNVYISFEQEIFNYNILLINLLISAGGLILTHLYRLFIIKQDWFRLDTTAIISRVLLSNIPLAFAFCLWQFLLLNVLLPEIENINTLAALLKPFMSAYLILLGWSLLYFTWSYIEHNRSRIIEKLKLQNDMQELELKSLRANLQPHFIFNSLNSVRALVKEDPEAAREAITRLSKILRTSISTKEDSITLDEELRLIEDYLHLEKIRFEERLQYEFQIAGKTRMCLIPPMLIQNMVENAVKHGISLQENGGTITLSTEIEKDYIRIRIKNEGRISEENKLKGTGFGMSSSQKRLHYLYPDAPPITMVEKNGYVVVEISIPNNIKPYEN